MLETDLRHRRVYPGVIVLEVYRRVTLLEMLTVTHAIMIYTMEKWFSPTWWWQCTTASVLAVGVPPLVWSDKLAADAKPWAEHLAAMGKLVHDTEHLPTLGEGENLASGGHTTTGPDSPEYAGLDRRKELLSGQTFCNRNKRDRSLHADGLAEHERGRLRDRQWWTERLAGVGHPGVPLQPAGQYGRPPVLENSSCHSKYPTITLYQVQAGSFSKE